MKEIKRYRIYELATQEYITGSNGKTSWGSFPSVFIKEEAKFNKKFKNFDNYYEVHEFKMKLYKGLNSKKEDYFILG